MNSELVSIVIPTFNRAYCIAESVGSVLQQTYTNLEVIVVDDGSTDNTKEVLLSLNDSRIRYVFQENAGACVARNYGVDLANGDIIAFHDSDDIWRPAKLEKQLARMRQDNSDFCICQQRTVRESPDGTRTLVHVTPSQDIKEEDLTFEHIIQKNFLSTQMLIGRRQTFLEERFDANMPRLQDWDLGIRLFARYSCAYVPEILVEQIIRSDSISSNPHAYAAALERIEHKYDAYLQSHKREHANMLSTAAKSLCASFPSESRRLFVRSFSIDHNPVSLAHAVHVRLLQLKPSRTH